MNPTQIYLIDSIESVQRRFSKGIPSLSNLSYTQRLDKLGLESLELRRLRFDLINYYKVLNGFSPIDPLNHFSIHHPISSSRSSVPHLRKPLRCNSKLSTSFFFRHVDAWNSLPASLKSVSSLHSFKSSLKKGQSLIFLKGQRGSSLVVLIPR